MKIELGGMAGIFRGRKDVLDGESQGKRPASKAVMDYLKSLEQQVGSWPHVSVRSHRFGGREFRFQSAEIGHVHPGGIVDIPFPRPLRDALVDERLAEEHHWVPNSGWVTFRVRSQDELENALWLLRLSYLRYALKAVPNPRDMFEAETDKLHLSARFKSLLEVFIRPSAGAREGAHQPVSA
jgi:hypothetical protein